MQNSNENKKSYALGFQVEETLEVTKETTARMIARIISHELAEGINDESMFRPVNIKPEAYSMKVVVNVILTPAN